MTFIIGFIVGCVVMGACMSAACAARHEKKFVVRRNRDTPVGVNNAPTYSRPTPPVAPLVSGSAECQCKGYQDLG